MRDILKDILTVLMIGAILIGLSACLTYGKQDYITRYSVSTTA